jgi:hypothetical protein
MTRSDVRSLGLALLLATLAVPPAHSQTLLRYKFKEGDSYRYTLEHRTQALAGEQVLGMQIKYDATWQVKAVDAEGKAKITQKIGQVRFEAETPLGIAQFDSNQSKVFKGTMDATLGPFLNSLSGSEFLLTADARGQVYDVTLPKNVQDGLKELRGGPGSGESFSMDGFKRLVSQPIQALPQEPVTKGKTWKHVDEIKMRAGKMKTETEYADEGPETRAGRMLEIIAIRPSASIQHTRGTLNVKIKSQSAKGSFAFDNATGRLVELNLTQQSEHEISSGENVSLQKNEAITSIKLRDKEK